MPYFEMTFTTGDANDDEVEDFGGAAQVDKAQTMVPKLHWWAWSSAGPAHGLTVFLAPGAAAAPADIIPLVSVAATPQTPVPPVGVAVVNNVSEACCCRVVPREQPGSLPDSGGVPWTLRVTTDGISGNGTLRGYWTWEPIES